LCAMGYVEHLSGGRYRLTDRFRGLGAVDADQHLVSRARAALQRLHEQTGETVNLGVLRHNRIVYLMTIESTHALRRVADPRSRDGDPVFTTALGRAIAAHLPSKSMQYLLRAAPPERRTPKTVTSVAALREVLRRARRDAYAIERDQTDLGVTCLGAPVFRGETVVAALSISAPTARAAGAEKRWLAALRKASDTLSRELEKGEWSTV
jgi:DNA-binding IclR family transcriptional regulator